MSIKLVINQVGLPAGRINASRSDGLHTGAQVSFKHTGTGVATFELLWVPDDDHTAVSSFVQSNNGCTFTPDAASIGGSYRVQITLVEGSVTSKLVRIFAIRTTTQALRLLALNERSNSDASFLNNGMSYVEESEFNESASSGPFAQGNYGGWYSAMVELFLKVESMS